MLNTATWLLLTRRSRVAVSRKLSAVGRRAICERESANAPLKDAGRGLPRLSSYNPVIWTWSAGIARIAP